MSIEIADYDPRWPETFATLRSRIWPAVERVALRIEHVGSTSVPGLAAKPAIDVDVVATQANVPLAIEAIASLGYQHLGDLGIAGREAFRAPEGSVRHNLYVCREDGLALRNHLAVRDYLRTNPEAAAAYAALKRQLAAAFPNDIDAYVDGKSEFLGRILSAKGFAANDVGAIARANNRAG